MDLVFWFLIPTTLDSYIHVPATAVVFTKYVMNMVNMMMIMTFPLPFPWLVIKSWLRSKRLNRKSNRLSDPHLDKMVSTWFSYS